MNLLTSFAIIAALSWGCGNKSPTKAPVPEPDPDSFPYPVYAFLGEEGSSLWYLVCEGAWMVKRYQDTNNRLVAESWGRHRDGKAIRDGAWSIAFTSGDTIQWAPAVFDFELEHWGDKVNINGTVYYPTERGYGILGTCEELNGNT